MRQIFGRPFYIAILTMAFACMSHGFALSAAPDAPPSAMKFRDIGNGFVLTTPEGMTLYVQDFNNTPNLPQCTGACLDEWKPYLASPTAKAQGDWSLSKRADGAQQWSYKGKPLYSYVKDLIPGDAAGDQGTAKNYSARPTGWRRVYEPLWLPPGFGMQVIRGSHILTTAAGLTLYASATDKDGKSFCDTKCVQNWKPVMAPSLAVAKGDWSSVKRDDGTHQWAFKKMPLYTSTADSKAGDMQTDPINNQWHAVVLSSGRAVPAGVTAQDSYLGFVFADVKGRTLYVNTRSEERSKYTCDEACMKKTWIAYNAPADAVRVGDWTVAEAGKDGVSQWLYRGRRVYLYALDQAPGEIKGHTFGYSGGDYPGGGNWEAIGP